MASLPEILLSRLIKFSALSATLYRECWNIQTDRMNYSGVIIVADVKTGVALPDSQATSHGKAADSSESNRGGSPFRVVFMPRQRSSRWS